MKTPAFLRLVIAVTLAAWCSLSSVGASGVESQADPVVIGTKFQIESKVLAETRTYFIHTPLKYKSGKEAYIVAEKIRSCLAETYFLKFRHGDSSEICVEHHCTSSIGVTLFLNHEFSQDDILKQADMAMYRAKEGGRNSIRFYEDGIERSLLVP